MRKSIRIVLPVLFFAFVSQSQELKKPHEFLIPKGTVIQHNKLSKPKYLPSKLDARSFGAFTPKYRSISSSAFDGLRTNISVQEVDGEGRPSRFKCSSYDAQSNTNPVNFWSEKLPELLRLSPQSGIAYKIRSLEEDDQQITHLKFDQTFDGVPVLDAEYFVHIYQDQSAMAQGNLLQPSQALQARLNPDDAYTVAKKHLSKLGIQCIDKKKDQASWIKTGLQEVILAYWQNPSDEVWHLVYRLDVYPNAMSRWLITVDAISGEILKALRNECMLHHPESSTHINASHEPGPQGAEKTTAKDLLDITRTIDVWRQGTDLYLLDGSRAMFKPSQFNLNDPAGAIWTIDAKNSNPNNIIWDQIKTSSNTFAKNAVSAHYNAGLAYEYFANTHGRNSINGKGGTIISLINVNDENGGGLDNAFWNGEAMFYGNGAQAFNPLAKGLDVGGHEMSHGVIQSTANLAYEGESGAINESFADIFGAMIDRDDWKIGEDVVKLNVFPSGALRNMSDPHNGAPANDFKWQPKHVNEQYKGNQDNGGVHINSGISNYAYYLFVQEIAKTSNEEQAKKTAEKIYYKALSQYLTRSSVFKDLRIAVEQACIDLHGNNSSIHNAAKKAFDLVGIGSSSGGGNYQKDLSVNPGKEFVVCTDDIQEGVYIGDLDKGTFSKVSDQFIKSKPSVTDNGAEIYYIGKDSKLYALFFNPATSKFEETILDPTPIYRNASISKDGSLLSVLYETEENKIHVYEFASSAWKTFTLTNPTTTNGVATSNVRYADYMDFEHSGQYLMYDCLSKLDRDGGGTYLYWDIGFLRVWDLATKTFGDGHIEKLFSNLPDNTSVGNPVYSKNSPYIMAFDYLEETVFGPTFSVLAANIETGDIGEIAIDRDNTGYPSYSVRDDYLLYNGFDNAQTKSLKFIKLAANKIQSNDTEQLMASGAQWGNWYANGKRSLVSTSNENKLKGVSINPNPFSSVLRINIESGSDQMLDYALFNITGQDLIRASVPLLTGNNVVQLQLQNIPPGIYYLKLFSGEGESGFTLIKVEE